MNFWLPRELSHHLQRRSRVIGYGPAMLEGARTATLLPIDFGSKLAYIVW
jgi:hypothetical protein